MKASDSPWLWIILRKLDLVRRNDVGIAVEYHEPRRPVEWLALVLLRNWSRTWCRSRASRRILHVEGAKPWWCIFWVRRGERGGNGPHGGLYTVNQMLLREGVPVRTL